MEETDDNSSFQSTPSFSPCLDLDETAPAQIRRSQKAYSQLALIDDTDTEPEVATPTGSSYCPRRSTSSSSSGSWFRQFATFKHSTLRQSKTSSCPRLPPLDYAGDEKHVEERSVLNHLRTDSYANSGEDTSYRLAIDRMKSHIDQFFANRQWTRPSKDIWKDDISLGLDTLFFLDNQYEELPHASNDDRQKSKLDPLRQMVEQFQDAITDGNLHHSAAPKFCEHMLNMINILDEYPSEDVQETSSMQSAALEVQRSLRCENDRLLHALRKLQSLQSSQREPDQILNDLIHPYEKALKSQEQDIKQRETSLLAQEKQMKDELETTRNRLGTRITELEKYLSTCIEEKDKIQLALDALHCEMKVVLDELEETKQQTGRYKAQASRLRASLKELQDRHDDSEEQDDDMEALRLLQQESERQAMELERESKRQAVTIQKLRHDIKLLEDKTKDTQLSSKAQDRLIEQLKHSEEAKSKQLIEMKEDLRRAQRTIAEHELRLEVLKQHQKARETLDLELQKSKAEVLIQKERVSSLHKEAESARRLKKTLKQRDTEVTRMRETVKNYNYNAALREQLEEEISNRYRQEFDVFMVQITRENRELSGQIVELETEMRSLQRQLTENSRQREYSERKSKEATEKLQRHQEEWALAKDKFAAELAKLTNLLELRENEVLNLYSKNLKMAHQLGEADTLLN
ncbi:hypothetical protein EC973_007718 [Apophysomyces ossiformis]|uniref:Uncharacterized protein n=1 Tax=Apophysomyces ossiformis TaxID=679940 RepID=A0A8H7BVD2_9FUNG|nr:hypothetical protein EC973_007718 [Apophysomyces ossiformis]